MSSGKGSYQEQQYAQPSVYSSGHHTGKPQPVTPRSNRVAPGAYTQQLGEDEISAWIQNLNLRASPSHSSKNFTSGESSHSRSALPPGEVSPPRWVSPSTKSVSAASYDPVGYESGSKQPPNARPIRPKSTTMSYPSASHRSPSSTWRKDKPEFVSPARSAYSQRFFHHSSTHLTSARDSPPSSDESWGASYSPPSSDESWRDYYIASDDNDFW